VKGGADREDITPSKVNLYFHGFLFADCFAASGLQYPLVGVFPPSEGFLPFVAKVVE